MRLRFRHAFLAGGSAAVLSLLYLTDPDQGDSTAMLVLSLVTPLIAVGFAHLSGKALHDYPEADMRALFRLAAQSSMGAGLALVALALITSALLGLFGRAAHAESGGPRTPGTPSPPEGAAASPALAAHAGGRDPHALARAPAPGLLRRPDRARELHHAGAPALLAAEQPARTPREEGGRPGPADPGLGAQRLSSSRLDAAQMRFNGRMKTATIPSVRVEPE